MSYDGIANLRTDEAFTARVEVASFEQANIYKDDGRADISHLAEDVMRSSVPLTLRYAICNAPGFGDTADPTTITDAQILSATQAVWPAVAAVLYPTG